MKVKVAQLSLTLRPHGLTIQSLEFSRLEYWSGLPFPSLGDLPNPGIESRSPTLQGDSLPAEPQWKPLMQLNLILINRKCDPWELGDIIKSKSGIGLVEKART